MNIKGLQKTTLLDYPGHVAATVFLGGCNFKCPFCHNMDIVMNSNSSATISEEELFSFLNKRRGVLEGVCITGGEPTLYNELPDFIKKIKQLGYLVKLDTNGTNPEMLNHLINERLIDYAAMDVKASYDKYMIVAGLNTRGSTDICDVENSNSGNVIINKIKESIALLKSGAIAHEFRTTVVSQYHDEEEIRKIGEILRGENSYFLQSFKESEFVLDKTLTAVPEHELGEFVEILREYVANPQLRGV